MYLRKNNRAILRLIQDQTRCKQQLNQVFRLHDCNPQRILRGLLNTKWTLEVFHDMLTTDKMIPELVEQYYPRSAAKRTHQDVERIQAPTEVLEALQVHLTPVET